MNLRGAPLLQKVKNRLAQSSSDNTGKSVAILRFTPPDDSDWWRTKTVASSISARQKALTFAALGFSPLDVVIDHTRPPREILTLINALNEDPGNAGIIIQFPLPEHLKYLALRIAPEKDLDGLLGPRSPHPACATAEGIARIVTPFAHDKPSIAVVGARGFVGGGVVRLLRSMDLEPIELDIDDDLRVVRDADVVVSTAGSQGILTAEHIVPAHRLVVDSGFVPTPDGPRGDVDPGAANIPQHLTPVPGGVGPIEMMVLAERLVRQELDPRMPRWRYRAPRWRERDDTHGSPYDVTCLWDTIAHDVGFGGGRRAALPFRPRRAREAAVESRESAVEHFGAGMSLPSPLELSSRVEPVRTEYRRRVPLWAQSSRTTQSIAR